MSDFHEKLKARLAERNPDLSPADIERMATENELDFIQDAFAQTELDQKTDAEIVVLLEQAWSEEPMLGNPRLLLMEQAMERLKRTGGGRLTDLETTQERTPGGPDE